MKAAPPPDDDDPPPKRPPKFCPWCGGSVLKRWAPNKLRSLYRGPGIRIAYVCLTCKVAVRAFKFPSEPLFETERAARAKAQQAYAKLEASGFTSSYAQDLYRRGKCTCIQGVWGRLASSAPCPLHAPLRRPGPPARKS